jgi:TRAP-type C4-dicarboxylate transport system permease small subunit
MPMSHFRAAMEQLYRLCILLAGGAMVLISAVIPWGVYTRKVLNSAASWPEPMAVLLAIVITFFGAAACYRNGMHMRVAAARNALPPALQRLVDALVELLMAGISVYMVIWGAELVATTWHQSIADFPWLAVGVTYLPIPIGGAITLLFVAERALLGPPPALAE